MSWTPERVERLKELRGLKLSASLIAEQLGGGLTRNAVCGKAWRLRHRGEGCPKIRNARGSYSGRIRRQPVMSHEDRMRATQAAREERERIYGIIKAFVRDAIAEKLSCGQAVDLLGARHGLHRGKHTLTRIAKEMGLAFPRDRFNARSATPEERARELELAEYRNRVNRERIEAMHGKEPAPLRLTLMQLGTRQCRWPSGDGPFTFCGHGTAPGQSYCDHHRRRAYQSNPKDIEGLSGLAMAGKESEAA